MRYLVTRSSQKLHPCVTGVVTYFIPLFHFCPSFSSPAFSCPAFSASPSKWVYGMVAARFFLKTELIIAGNEKGFIYSYYLFYEMTVLRRKALDSCKLFVYIWFRGFAARSPPVLHRSTPGRWPRWGLTSPDPLCRPWRQSLQVTPLFVATKELRSPVICRKSVTRWRNVTDVNQTVSTDNQSVDVHGKWRQSASNVRILVASARSENHDRLVDSRPHSIEFVCFSHTICKRTRCVCCIVYSNVLVCHNGSSCNHLHGHCCCRTARCYQVC